MKFAKSTGCFYPDDENYSSLPLDIIPVPQSDFDSAMQRAPGDTLDVVNGRVVVVPKPATTLAEKKAMRWTDIKAERDRRIQSGGYKVGAKWFHSDTFSRTQQMGLVMMGANIPAGTPWKTMDGSTVTMTQTLAGQIFGTAAASDIAIFAAAEAHRVALEASADPATYDFSTGWPKAFGE
jgi:hypothetical protein